METPNKFCKRVYVASSWRNQVYESIVERLRLAGHDVFDFRNPVDGSPGFGFSQVDPNYPNWKPADFIEKMSHPVATAAFKRDRAALEWCDTLVLVLPSGRSAHLEAGYAAGQGKDTYILLAEDGFEPELMYGLNTRCSTSIDEIVGWMRAKPSMAVERWHSDSGGHITRTADVALRLLRETVELCVASGAAKDEVIGHVAEEVAKALRRREFKVPMADVDVHEATSAEWADCAILLEVIRAHLKVDPHAAIRSKVSVLWGRAWQATPGGALYRPGMVPQIPVEIGNDAAGGNEYDRLLIAASELAESAARSGRFEAFMDAVHSSILSYTGQQLRGRVGDAQLDGGCAGVVTPIKNSDGAYVGEHISLTVARDGTTRVATSFAPAPHRSFPVPMPEAGIPNGSIDCRDTTVSSGGSE
jgi:hypothetical protein